MWYLDRGCHRRTAVIESYHFGGGGGGPSPKEKKQNKTKGFSESTEEKDAARANVENEALQLQTGSEETP